MAILQATGFHPTGGTSASDIPISEEQITVTASNAQTGAVGTAGRNALVRIYCDTDSIVAWGTNPVAATGGAAGRYWPAGYIEYVTMDGSYLVGAVLV